jgi:hypothetical protein
MGACVGEGIAVLSGIDDSVAAHPRRERREARALVQKREDRQDCE